MTLVLREYFKYNMQEVWVNAAGSSCRHREDFISEMAVNNRCH